MPDADRLTPADPKDLADALAFALRYSGRKRVNDAAEIPWAHRRVPIDMMSHGRSTSLFQLKQQ
jgi:hypothetical protein